MQAAIAMPSGPGPWSERHVSFVFPELVPLAALSAVLPEEPSIAPPAGDLVFTEAEVAKIVAAVQAQAEASARLTAQASVEAGLQAATLALGRQLDAFTASRADDLNLIKIATRRLFALFAEACLETVAGGRLCQAMTRAAERVLAELPEGTEVAVDVSADLSGRMEELLATRLAPSSPLRVSVRGRPGLLPGDIAMSWKEGWAEWSFERLRQTFLRQLADDLATMADGNTFPAAAASDDVSALRRPDITDPNTD